MKFEDYTGPRQMGWGSIFYTERYRAFYRYNYNGNNSQGNGDLVYDYDEIINFPNNIVYEYKRNG